MRRLTLGIVASFALSGAPAFAQWPQPPYRPANELIIQNYSPEFPPLGAAYSTTIRFQFLADHTARLLKQAPGAPETRQRVLSWADAAAFAGRLLPRETAAFHVASPYGFGGLIARPVLQDATGTDRQWSAFSSPS